MKEKALSGTGMPGLSLAPLSEQAKRAQSLVRVGALCAAGFLLSRAQIFGLPAPFGAALTAAAPPPATLAVGISCALGCLSLGMNLTSLRLFAAVCAACVLRLLLAGLFRAAFRPLFAPVSAFSGCILSGAAAFALSGALLGTAARMLLDAVLAAGAAWLFSDAARLLLSERRPEMLSRREWCALAVSGGALLCALSAADYFGVSPGRIAAMLVVLFAARCGDASCGAAAGICAGAALGLAGTDLGYLSFAFALGGLLAGLLAPLGKFACALAFLFADGLMLTVSGAGAPALPGMYEALLAGTAFVLHPASLGAAVSRLFHPDSSEAASDAFRRTVSDRLDAASTALSEISFEVTEVTRQLARIGTSSLTDVYHGAAARVCAQCGSKKFCWGPAFDSTMETFNALSEVLRKTGAVGAGDFPSSFIGRCGEAGRLAAQINSGYRAFAAREIAERRAQEVRVVMADQFRAMSRVLLDLKEEFVCAQQPDGEAAARVREVIESHGMTPAQVLCTLDGQHRMTVRAEIVLPVLTSVNRAGLTAAMSAAVSRQMDAPRVTRDETRMVLEFEEKRKFGVEFGVSQHSRGNDPFCGDSCRTFTDQKGRPVMLISDGMGSGSRAAVEAAMASGLFCRLLEAGFDADRALGMVNSALLVKSGDEATTTLDAACIDRFSGTVTFFKAGAPVSFVRKGKKILRCDAPSLPLGILRDVSFERLEVTVGDGDLVVMLSDGVADGECPWLEEQMLKFGPDDDPKELAERLVALALEHCGTHEDDMTVLAAAVRAG